MGEEIVQANQDAKQPKAFTLMDGFKLHLWLLWKARVLDDNQVIKVQTFITTMTDDNTIDACLAEIDNVGAWKS